MVSKANRWINKAPVALIDDEAQFNWFYRQLRLSTRAPDSPQRQQSPQTSHMSPKSSAVSGVLGDIEWQEGDTAAYVVAGECRGLMQFELRNGGRGVEIGQLVTAADARGAAVPMIEWIFKTYPGTTIELFPLAGSAAAYARLGFIAFGNGGYLRLDPARSEMWLNANGVYRYGGPPPPPPDDDVAPPPPPPG